MAIARLLLLLVVLAALGLTHLSAYKFGADGVRVRWERDVAERNAAALVMEQEARAKEQRLVEEKQKVEVRYADEKRRRAASAAAADRELGRLRDALVAAPAEFGSEAPAACARVDGGAGLERQLLGHCATTLVQLAQVADQQEARIVGLQGYIRNVCLR
jgi:hypothetical protein